MSLRLHAPDSQGACDTKLTEEELCWLGAAVRCSEHQLWHPLPYPMEMRTFSGLLTGRSCAGSIKPWLILLVELLSASQEVVQRQLLPQGGLLATWLRRCRLALACRGSHPGLWWTLSSIVPVRLGTPRAEQGRG